MQVERLAEGLWRWTALHPEWQPGDDWEREVGCVYAEAPDAVLLIDPLIPADDEEGFWKALDRDVERLGRPVAVLLELPLARAERRGGRGPLRRGTQASRWRSGLPGDAG